MRDGDADRRRIIEPVVDRLGLAARCDHACFPKHCEVLRQRGLRQAERFLQRAGCQLASAKLAQDHQPLLVAERSHEAGRLAGAGFDRRVFKNLGGHAGPSDTQTR